MPDPRASRLRRLAEELVEAGLPELLEGADPDLILDEVDHALRPTVHERRIPSSGTILRPRADRGTWSKGTQLDIVSEQVAGPSLENARRFADGLSSWLVRGVDGDDAWLMFDRPAGSERDLTVLARVLEGTIVQRHPSGTVRIVGDFGVLRWDGLDWHHEPPLTAWIDLITACKFSGDAEVLTALVEFAVHDLGAVGIGALLIYRPGTDDGPAREDVIIEPPRLDVRTPFHLAPLRHALSQIDGAAVFDGSGVLRRLGVRVVPSTDAEETIEALGGTRHTSGRRYSFDDPTATVIAVSEDGPVTVLRDGEVLGRSPREGL